MWLASDVVVQLLHTTAAESFFLHADLLSGTRKRFAVPGCFLGMESEPQGAHFGVLCSGEDGNSLCLYKNDATLLQTPIKGNEIEAITWLRSSVLWVPKGMNGFLSFSQRKGVALWFFNGSEYLKVSVCPTTFPERIISVMVKTLGDRSLLFVALEKRIHVYSMFLQEKQLNINLLGQQSLDNSSFQSFAWDRNSSHLIVFHQNPSADLKALRFDVNMQPLGAVDVPCSRILAKHPVGGVVFMEPHDGFRHYDMNQTKPLTVEHADILPTTGAFFSSHGNALVIIRDGFHEITVLSASEDPMILGKSLVVKTLLSTSLGLEIVWPVRQHLQRSSLAPLLKAIMSVASAEKVGLVSIARIYAQLCTFCKPEWYPGAALFEALAALDIASQEYLALNPNILPLVERFIGESLDLPLADLKLRINPVRSHYFVMLAARLLEALSNGNERVMCLFGLASFRKRFSLVTLLSIASIYDSWDQCPLQIYAMNSYLQMLNRVLQPLYSAHGQEAVSNMSVESMFTGQQSALTDLLGQIPLPSELQAIGIPHATVSVMNRRCRLCSVRMSDADARGVCFCGGQIK